LISLVAVYGQC